MENGIAAAFPLSERDLEEIVKWGKTRLEVQAEAALLRSGAAYARLIRACAPGDGITVLSPAKQSEMASLYESSAALGRAMKFVAASGAGSRMFPVQAAILQGSGVSGEKIEACAARGDPEALVFMRFIRNLQSFAFYDRLAASLSANGLDIRSLLEQRCYREVVAHLLEPEGLNYGSIPKGLILFHQYPGGPRTAIEEHLVEGAGYLRDQTGQVRIHFTSTPEHEPELRKHLASAAERWSDANTSFRLTVSIQEKRTDTVMLDGHNNIVRDRSGKLLFRPAGHGALLRNLETLTEDIVFVRTVDNALPDRGKGELSFQHKVLGGTLISLQRRVFHFLREILRNPTEDAVREAGLFAREELNVSMPSGFDNLGREVKVDALFRLLNRPIRVCAMVRHAGEPGGGPFWTRNQAGQDSLQIVEQSQVDFSSMAQRELWHSCLYLNPAVLACGIRDYCGRTFDLRAFQDSSAVILGRRQHEGTQVHVLERPGLWNGGMAGWLTVFLETPREIVSPVKNVMDLLNEPHRT
jgi:hypothetical protein